MGPPAVRTISQEAFETVVKENIDDLGMDPDEALEDAIQTLTLQDVDLSGIIKCLPGEINVKDNPVLLSINELKTIVASLESSDSKQVLNEEANLKLVNLLDNLYELCSAKESDNATIAARNGGVEQIISLCSSLDSKFDILIASALKALSSIICDLQSSESFRQIDGPKLAMDILRKNSKSFDIRSSVFSVIASASAGNEVVKELFMLLKVDEILLESVKEKLNNNLQSLYDAIRVLLTQDDFRVAASQVFGYARKLAKLGLADALVNALHNGVNSSCLPSACAALKAVAVNDEICKSIAESGGIDVMLQCIDESSEQGSRVIAKSCCSLLHKLAGSDANKIAIVQKGGLDKLIKLSSRFSDDPSVIQEVMAIVTVLSLRLPENAAKAMEAGIGDLTMQSMVDFPTSYQMQKQACLMIRNLVVRNPENRVIFLNGGIEKLIRKAKGMQGCKDAATDALRDLGVDDYNA
ncbi:hypothetical protein LUZ60_001237 [Juncus effusus]|nr:hypothetical protein LUZ60_001237 [Juncus effusus]